MDLGLDVNIEPDVDLHGFAAVLAVQKPDKLAGVESRIHVHDASVLDPKPHLPLLLPVAVEVNARACSKLLAGCEIPE